MGSRDRMGQISERVYNAIDAVTSDRNRSTRALQDLALASAGQAAQVSNLTKQGFAEYHHAMNSGCSAEEKDAVPDIPRMQFRAILSGRCNDEALCSLESVRPWLVAPTVLTCFIQRLTLCRVR